MGRGKAVTDPLDRLEREPFRTIVGLAAERYGEQGGRGTFTTTEVHECLQAAGMPRAPGALYRNLQTLVETGILEKLPAHKTYRLAPGMSERVRWHRVTRDLRRLEPARAWIVGIRPGSKRWVNAFLVRPPEVRPTLQEGRGTRLERAVEGAAAELHQILVEAYGDEGIPEGRQSPPTYYVVLAFGHDLAAREDEARKTKAAKGRGSSRGAARPEEAEEATSTRPSRRSRRA